MVVSSIYGQDDYSTSVSSTKKEVEKSPVGIPCIGYDIMTEDWELIHDLLGGTKAMQAAGTKWLPQEAAESSTNYNARLSRSILYNGFRDTLNKLTNRPFTNPILVKDLPAEIAYLKDDVDGTNKSLGTFLKNVLEILIKYGVVHIFVDHSVVPEVAEGKTITKEQERQLGVRVYLSCISPKDLIGWQTERVDKELKLTQIRIKQSVIEKSGDYGDAEVTYINVYNEENWEVHRQEDEKGEKYNLEKTGDYNFGRIPLVTIYANRTGVMTAESPLMDLAWLNLAHWQSYSDQRNILRFSRFGLIFGKGLPDEMVEKGTLEIGPTKAYLTTNETADMKYVEHSGKSIEAGQKDVEDIETKMRILGNQPLIKDLPDTATAERIDETRTVSQLQSWVRSLENGILQALKFACEWRKIDPPKTMGVEIYSDFEALVLGNTDKDHILKARELGEITRTRYLKEAQRRGIYSQDMKPEEEAKEIDEQSTNELKNLLSDEEIEDEGLEEGGE